MANEGPMQVEGNLGFSNNLTISLNKNTLNKLKKKEISINENTLKAFRNLRKPYIYKYYFWTNKYNGYKNLMKYTGQMYEFTPQIKFHVHATNKRWFLGKASTNKVTFNVISKVDIERNKALCYSIGRFIGNKFRNFLRKKPKRGIRAIFKTNGKSKELTNKDFIFKKVS